MYCPKCGSPNAEDARFCASCGQAQGTVQTPSNTYAGSAAPPPQQFSGTGGAAPQMAPQGLPPVGFPTVRTGGPLPGAPGSQPYAAGKSAGLAVFLSFLIPGMGQFYCGATTKGGIMLGIFFASWMLVGFGIGFVGVTIVWIWSMIDAYNLASGKTPLS